MLDTLTIFFLLSEFIVRIWPPNVHLLIELFLWCSVKTNSKRNYKQNPQGQRTSLLSKCPFSYLYINLTVYSKTKPNMITFQHQLYRFSIDQWKIGINIYNPCDLYVNMYTVNTARWSNILNGLRPLSNFTIKQQQIKILQKKSPQHCR